MAECLISIGSNLGDRALAIDTALTELAAHSAIALRRTSSRHITKPLGGPAGQGPFVNAAARIETALPPHRLLSFLQSLETRAGRTRKLRWGARSLDLDLLLYDEVVLNDERLLLPHPRMAFRRFVLAPAAEIAAEMMHPLLGRSVRHLLMHLDQAPNYVAVTGLPTVGKTKLVQAAATNVGAIAIIQAMRCERDIATAGPTVESELEFLDARCDLLRDVAPAGEEPYVISDFWLSQSLAYACRLPSDQYAQVESAWLNACRQIVPPKLVVFVETNFDKGVDDDRTALLSAIQTQLRDRVFASGAPWLRLDATVPPWNEEEVTSAILAM